MKIRALIASIGLIAALGLVGCGKDKDKKSGEGKAKTTEVKKGGDGLPTAAEVAKMDCPALCAKQLKCNKKSGVKIADEAKATKMCMDGCKMMQAPGVYKPEIQGKTAKAFMSYADKNCD